MNSDIKSWIRKNKGDATFLCICPASEEIVAASIKEASEGNFAPIFVATPRQVDANRGYTGWSQEGLMEFIRSTSEELGYTGPYLVARDHGGPYQSGRDRGRPEVSLGKAMGYAKEMFAQDLRSGFGVLHVDATEDPSGGTMGLDEVAQRTAELIAYIEGVKEGEDRPRVYYEVGTEEISGGITEPGSFEKFIQLLKSELMGRGCGQAIKQLLFIVGQVGTTMRIDMTNHFDPQLAETLVNIASRHDLFLKVHYTDWLEAPILEQFPRLGIGAANVGPELAAAIVKAWGELEKREVQALRKVGENIRSSNIIETIGEAAIKGAPWRRFAPRDLETQELEGFAQEHRGEIALCVGRYVIKDPEVIESRQKLYENLKRHASLDDPQQFVINAVQDTIRRYIKAFNLK